MGPAHGPARPPGPPEARLRGLPLDRGRAALSRVALSRARPLWAAILVAAALTLAGCGKDGASTDARIPRDFVGIAAQDVFAGDSPYRDRALERIRAAGVGLIRQTFDWAAIEARPGRYELAAYDRFVRAAAQRGSEILPVLFNPPAFFSSAPAEGAERGTYPPRRPSDMARFAGAMVERYGPQGTLWRERPELPAKPIRAWQVWNEPNVSAYWPSGPDAREYTALLRVVSAAIKRRDPEAEVVTGGLPESASGVPLLRYVDDLYRAGAPASFDTLAIHPYARNPEGVAAAVRGARGIMRRRGDGAARIWVTELGWASAGPPSKFTVGAGGQAARIGDVLRLLFDRRRELGLRGVVYFGWRDGLPYRGGRDFWGLHTGLLDLQGRPKPALASFKAAVRGG